MAAVTAADVAKFLGRGGDTSLVALAGDHLPLVTEMARMHTRGVGFDDGEPNDAIAAVIVSATARLTNNPELLQSEQIGDYSARYTTFQGWSILERAVLDAHRRKAA
ncbi:hypothetical protein [Leucobacter denitrificans]|uniref:Uncharacterized protein n=1 Tax=Leucobacter denitrificans TaxID=683042 RepID=A0A7G9S3C3_9MICO|nr:hypothetical protein [Leucobacter denitrificans]QNN62348.1 hypothetical protein H9L06_08755 [Leucobacter denitrificans]